MCVAYIHVRMRIRVRDSSGKPATGVACRVQTWHATSLSANSPTRSAAKGHAQKIKPKNRTFAASLMDNKKFSFLLSHIFEVANPIFYEQKPADLALHYFFKNKKYLGASDRRIISETLYQAIRTLPRTELLLKQHQLGDNLIVPVCIYHILSQNFKSSEVQQCFTEKFRYPEHLWQKIHDALQTEYQPVSEIESIAYHTAFPVWFVEELSKTFSIAETVQILTILNQNANVHLRVNTYLTNIESVMEALKKEGIHTHKGNISPESLIIDKRKPIFATQTFKQGLIELQDEGSQLVAWLVNPKAGKTVLDACAGGGGKTLHLATLMKGKGTVFAYEVNPERFGNIKQRIRRSQLQNIQLLDSKEKFEKFTQKYTEQIDYVLVDAPCSASGTLRRNPDLKLRLKKEQVDALPHVQLDILQKYQKFVRKGGRLVYVTCSVFECENKAVVEKFLSLNPEFKCVPVCEVVKEIKLPVDLSALQKLTENQTYLNLLPHQQDTDGFFVAVLERAN